MEAKIKQIRRDILQSAFEAGACHIGSSLSCVDILVDLFYNRMKDDDLFLFSKASGAGAYYAVLADKGYFPKDRLADYLKRFPECSKEVPGVIHSVGSVGHGLSVAVGMAIADRNKKVYVLLSDGECQEGSTYEAILFAGQHKLDNLYVIVDNNGFQACGAIKDILDLGNVFSFMIDTLPNCEIVNTIKGKGVSFCENDYKWHYGNLTEKQLKLALKENE